LGEALFEQRVGDGSAFEGLLIVISRFVETFAPGAQEREIVVGFAEDWVGGNGGFVV
jgi:hypothetical protein